MLACYGPAMTYEEKTQLARTGFYDNESAGLRVRAARMSIGLSQEKLANEISRDGTTIVAIEKGRQQPSWELMMWLFNNHRIDMNFIVGGSFSQLPEDVQERIFSSLS